MNRTPTVKPADRQQGLIGPIMGGVAIPVVTEIARVAARLAFETAQADRPRPSPIAKEAVADRVAEAIRADPLVEHVTNGEPWYASRVTWGYIVTAASALAGLFGFALAPEAQALVVGAGSSLGALVGAAITHHGRWRATRPIGR